MRHSGQKHKSTAIPISQVQELQFSIISNEQIEGISVCEINQPNLYENNTPVRGGPNDLRLGVSSGSFTCQTCGEKAQCQGHFGHIKLQESILHYGYLKDIEKILRCICHNCFKVKRPKDPDQRKKFVSISKIQSPKQRLSQFTKLLQNLRSCCLTSGEQQKNEILKNFKGCGYKNNPKKIYTKNYLFYIEDGGDNKPRLIGRQNIKNMLANLSLYSNQCQLLGFTATKPINLIIENLIVVPPQIRPYIAMKNEINVQDDITHTYIKIIRLNKRLKAEKGTLTPQQREEIVQDIEHLAATIMFKLDTTSLNRGRVRNFRNKKKIKNFKAITDRIQGKEGRFRENLMGKRVDFSARTVISPDPSLALDQLGIPVKIARKLTYPQEINQLNYEKIVDLCLQGQVKTLIRPPEHNLKNEHRIINIEKLQASSREQIQKYINYGMVAERSLQNGDLVLMNRQPTLHRMSMMSHRVKILPYNTFRLNLSACTPYNADFDGDQMNLHVPQSYESLAQLKKISSVPNQIVAPKNNAPVMGIVQDSLLGIYLLTLRDSFLKRQEIMNLLMWLDSADNQSQQQFNIKDLPLPAILRPQPLWTGKQLLSIIIPKSFSIKLIKNKIEGAANLTDSNLIIKNGELITGSLQKDVMGSGAGSMIHSIWLEDGPQAANDFITNVQRMVTNWMLDNSFSVGASDIVPKKQIQDSIDKQKESIQRMYYRIFSQYNCPKTVQEQNLHQKGKKIGNSFEFYVNQHLNNRLCKAQQLIRNNLSSNQNNIYRIIEAKSKGSETNLAQILFSVGNQNVNGKRCPLGFSRRAFPHFCREDHTPQSRGYVYNSFYQGLKPHQFFFHSMGGRQGLSDTAVKTSHVGYLQRKLVKCLQDIVVNYDGSVRDSRDNLLQKCYGEDGFISEYLEKQRIAGAQLNKDAFRKRYKWDEKQLTSVYGYKEQKISRLKSQYAILYHYRKRLRQIYIQNNDSTSIEYFCPIKIERLINKINNQFRSSSETYKFNEIQYQKIDPLQIYENVEKLIDECVPPLTKQLDNYFKSKISMEIFDDDDSMSEDEEENSENFNLKTQVLNKDRKFQNKNADSFEQQVGLQIFRIHLRYNLSSRNLIKKFKITRTCFIKLLKEIKLKFHQGLAPAGEAIGSLAAQSIGEPTTQMTLNTFHLAGVSDKNVTLGLPRLQQLLDISKNIKTPSMTIFPLKKILHKQRTIFENQVYLLNYLTYHLPQRSISDFLISSRLIVGFRNKKTEEISNKNTAYWGIVLVFNCKKFTSKKYWLQILQKMEEFMSKVNSSSINLGSFQVIQQKQFNDTVSKIQNPEILLKFYCRGAHFRDPETEQTGQNEDIYVKSQKRIQDIPLSYSFLGNCHVFEHLLTVESQIRQLPLFGIKGIKGVKTSKKTILNIPKSHALSIYSSSNNQSLRKDYQVTIFQTDGTNLKQCLSHPQVDYRRSYSNDIYQISQVLGIQAARQAFLNQFKQILNPYGIYINFRHLTVLADWICMRGKMTAINRFGINKSSDISIIRKATYQQTSKVLMQSAIFSEHDYLRGVSERVMFGQPIRSGSNSFNLLIDLNKVGDYVSKAELDKKNIKNDDKVGEGFSQLYFDKTPILNSPSDSFHQGNMSSFHSHSFTPDKNFSPNTSFAHFSPQLKQNSPQYLANSSLLNFSDYDRSKFFSAANMSSLSNFNLNNSSIISPNYLQKNLSINSEQKSPNYGYGGLRSKSQFKTIISPTYCQSPIYKQEDRLKIVSKVQEDREGEQEYDEF